MSVGLDREGLIDLRGGGNGGALGVAELYRPYLTLLARLKSADGCREGRRTDVVQDAFAEAARQFGRFRGSAGPS